MKKVGSVLTEIGYLIAISVFCTAGLIRWAGLDTLIGRVGDNLVDGSDSLFSATVTKMMIAGEWGPFSVIKSVSLGAPFGFQLGDFPSADQFFNFCLWVLTWFTKNPFVVLNIFYFSSFYFCAFSFFYSARMLRLPRLLSAALGVAFGLLPFHFYRYSHFFLAAYLFVPPLTVVLVYLAQNFSGVAGTKKLRAPLAVGTLVLASLSGIYYAFFFCYFLTVALFISQREEWRKKAKFYFGVLLLVIAVGLTNFIPNFRFNSEFGKNSAVASRDIGDSERGGLRLATFLLPTNNYFISVIREKIREYQTVLPPVEGTQEYAGSLAVIGFLAAVAAVFGIQRSEVRTFGLLSFTGILFATLGGLNILFGLFITASFRSETRISVFLACFGLMALGFSLRRRFEKLPRFTQFLVALFMACWVFFDQVPTSQAGLAPEPLDKQNDLIHFVHEIERACADDAAILQMPYTQFPEAPSVGDMGPYEHFKPYLYSERLRWSFGAMRGRSANEMIRNLSHLPFDVNELRRAGYEGVEINLAGYPGAERENILAAVSAFKTKPITSESGRYLFFPIPNSKCDR